MAEDTSAGEEPASGSEYASRSYPVEEDMVLQRRTWVAERVGWVLLGLLVVAALLGVFSVGALSTTSAAGGDIEVAYQRFERVGAATRITVMVPAQPGEEVVVRFGAALLDAFTIDSLHPQPSEERPTGDGVAMTFHAPAGIPFSIYLSLTPELRGLVRSQIALRGKPPAELTQFIFP